VTSPPDVGVGSGLLAVDKPAGLTSHDVVARVRRLARTRKVGHAGTLDPMATGVLLIGIGKATRLLGHLALTEKTYAATIRLGAATTTDDAEGEVVSTAPVSSLERLDEEQIRAALRGFVGDLEQVPATVSALKVAGRRAHERVRAGEAVELAARPVTVHELRVDSVRRGDGHVDVDVVLRCSSGTYVRAVARDVGSVLGVGGHLSALRRTAVGPVDVREATPLVDLEEAGTLPVVPMAEAVARFFPVVEVDETGARDVGHGRPLDLPPARDEQLAAADERPVAVLGPDGSFLALYRPGAEGLPARPVAVFV
jgi:tRNA pseudouridine55 synthase